MIAISENQEWHFKILSIVWMLFSVWAIILQTILQKKIVKITTWNHSAGWQREIGLWNVGAVVLIAMHIALKIAVTPILVPVLLVWSGLFGVNHFMSYLKDKKANGHLSGFIMNIFPFIWSAAIILFIN